MNVELKAVFRFQSGYRNEEFSEIVKYIIPIFNGYVSKIDCLKKEEFIQNSQIALFTRIIPKFPGYKFNITINFQSELDSGIVGQELEKIFKKNTYRLSLGTRIKIEKEKQEWIIRDEDKEYFIIKNRDEEAFDIYMEEVSLYYWVSKGLRWVFLEFIRRKKHKEADITEEDYYTEWDGKYIDVSIDKEACLKKLHDYVGRAVIFLTKQQKKIMEMRCYKLYSQEKMANRLKTSEENIRVQIFKIMKQLREIFTADELEEFYTLSVFFIGKNK